MKKVGKWVLIVVGALLLVFVVGGYMIPSKWSVTETETIVASPDAIYGQIANLRNWQNWSPWTLEKDPTQIYTYEGPESGVGAKWLWTSENMGKGWLLINKADPMKGIGYELFIDMNNHQSTLHGAISYEPAADVPGAQKVIWVDEGDAGSSLVQRWMTLMIKPMLSGEMKEGLKKLKTLTENK